MPTTGPTQDLKTATQETPTQSVVSFPSAPGPHSILFTFKEYKYEYARAGEQLLLNTYDRGATWTGNLTGIQLPIPAALNDNDSLIVENITQSALEAAAGEYIAGMANGITSSDLNPAEFAQSAGAAAANFNMEDFYTNGMGALGEQIKKVLGSSVGSVSRDIMYLLRSRLPAGVSQAADRAIGSTVNPKASLAFEGVNLKTHTYSWPLFPRNKEESEKIRNIIRILKQNSLPSYQTLSTGGFKAYLKYPSLVDTYLLGVNPEYFVKFKTSMIRSVNVEYGASGLVSVVKGGKPASINLTIELIELDIHTAEDYGGTSGGMSDEPGSFDLSTPTGPAGGPIPTEGT